MICKRIGESMAQLFFKYSTMNAGKSIELIKVAYNYEERGKRVFCLTPKVDSRYGEGVIASRVGLQRTAVAISEDMDILEVFMRENEKQPIDCVLVDEGQFLKKHHVEELVKIEEIKTICWCGRKATMVARVEDGKLVKEGKQIIVGGNNMYVSLCRKHYNDGRISDDEKYYGYTK